jgi:hypothetical protein
MKAYQKSWIMSPGTLTDEHAHKRPERAEQKEVEADP